MRPRVLVLGSVEDPPPGIAAADALADVGYAVTAEELEDELGSADAALAWDFERDPLMSCWHRARSLRWIQAASAGVDRLLFPELVASDVIVTNTRGVFEETMAEYVLGLIVAFAKDFATTFRHTRERVWQHRDTERVAGKGVLVVGVGPIGRAVARAVRALGVEVRGVGRSGRPGDPDFGEVLGVDRLSEAVSWADFVVNVLPATPETHHVFGAEAFAAMKPTAAFLNVGRGTTVDEDALVAALLDGGIAGAGLDVFEEEPLPQESPLWALPNVVVSPHMSGDFHGWEAAIVDVFLDNLGRFVRDEPLRNVVHKRLGYVSGE